MSESLLQAVEAVSLPDGWDALSWAPASLAGLADDHGPAFVESGLEKGDEPFLKALRDDWAVGEPVLEPIRRILEAYPPDERCHHQYRGIAAGLASPGHRYQRVLRPDGSITAPPKGAHGRHLWAVNGTTGEYAQIDPAEHRAETAPADPGLW